MNITEQSILLFDMDGTVIDTNLANFLSYQMAIKEIINNDITYLQNQFTTNRFDNIVLKNKFNLTELEYQKIITLKQKYFNLFIKKTKLIKNTINFIEKYKENKKIMVTNANKKRSLELIKFHKLDSYFHHYFFNNYGNKYENTIKNFKLNKKFVIAFDNDDNEIELANDINIKCINVSQII